MVNSSPRPAFAENKNLATALATLSVYIFTGGGWVGGGVRTNVSRLIQKKAVCVWCVTMEATRAACITQGRPPRAIPVTSIARSITAQNKQPASRFISRRFTFSANACATSTKQPSKKKKRCVSVMQLAGRVNKKAARPQECA